MANKELEVINSVCLNKDLGVLMTENVDSLFVAYEDVWKSLKSYYNKYHAIPDIEVLQERFDKLEKVEVRGASAHYLDGLKNEFIDNRMNSIFKTALKKIDNGESPVRMLDKAQAELAKLNKFSHAARDLDVMDFDNAAEHYDEVRRIAEEMGGTPGIPTGISFIDSAYPSGLAPGDLVVVLGWTGRAKSLFTTLVGCNAFDKGFNTMIVSLEMSPEKVRDRIYTIQGSGLFRNSHLANGDVNIDDFRQFSKKYEDRRGFIVVSNDGSGEITPNFCQAKIDQHRPRMLIFDYAQLGSDNEHSIDMTARMRNMSKQFKALATANKIPVILISSATPDSSVSAQTPPTIEQVAWSKQLAYDADLAFAVHKEDDSNRVAIVSRKNRNGDLFAGYIDWDIDRGIIREDFTI